MKFFTVAVIGLTISTSAISGMLQGNSSETYRSSLEGDSLVKFELAKVVRLQPIQSTRVYNVTRTSCTMVEDLSGAVSAPTTGAVVDATNQSRMVQRCIPYSDREYKQIIIAYDVTFEYHGQVRTVRMQHDPGTAVRVKTVTNVFVME